MDHQIRGTIASDGEFHATFYDIKKNEPVTTASVPLLSNPGFSIVPTILKSFLSALIIFSYMIQIKEYDENAFKGYQIKLKDGRFPSNDKEIVLSEESLKKSSKK